MHRSLFAASLLILLAGLPVEADPPLPVVEEVEWAPLRDHCRQLLRALDKRGAPLPAKTVAELTALLRRPPDDLAAACAAVQNRLDAHCLIAVTINAESRVKAARGPAAARLRQNQTALVLIKIYNEAGVTQGLRLHGPELIRSGERGPGRWLEAVLDNETPFVSQLSGRRLEYRLLRLTPRQSGKREATLQFDVGQGTQDLGFRAETPILFSIRE
jgi:hypothetical protein